MESKTDRAGLAEGESRLAAAGDFVLEQIKGHRQRTRILGWIGVALVPLSALAPNVPSFLQGLSNVIGILAVNTLIAIGWQQDVEASFPFMKKGNEGRDLPSAPNDKAKRPSSAT